jgi:hypothetical protein
MTEEERREFLSLVQSNIATHGQHITLVPAKLLPRFAYTIGLSSLAGFEAVLAGASYFSGNDVKSILNGFRDILLSKPGQVLDRFDVAGLGEFTLRQVAPWWSEQLLRGALDYFDATVVRCLQVVPNDARWTIDVPDLTSEPDSTANRAWRWLVHPWTYAIPERSVATTNLAALRGDAITEAARWEEQEWELFAGAGPGVPPEDIRVVPLGILLACDPSLAAVAGLHIGSALWREGAGSEWHEWTSG